MLVKKSIKTTLSILMFYLLSLSGLGAREYILKYAHSGAWSDDDPQQIAARYLKTWLERESGGQISVRIYSSRQLESSRDMLEGLSINTIDVINIPMTELRGQVPQVLFYDIPGLFESDREAEAFFTSSAAEFVKTEIEKRLPYAEAGPLATTEWWNHLHYVQEKKAKIGVTNPLYAPTLRDLGAEVVKLPEGELFGAFHLKTLDGVFGSSALLVRTGVDGLLGGTLWYRYHLPLSITLIHRKWLEGLPSDLQALVREGLASASRVMIQRGKLMQESAVEESMNKGMVITIPDDQARRELRTLRDKGRRRFTAEYERYGQTWDDAFMNWVTPLRE